MLLTTRFPRIQSSFLTMCNCVFIFAKIVKNAYQNILRTALDGEIHRNSVSILDNVQLCIHLCKDCEERLSNREIQGNSVSILDIVQRCTRLYQLVSQIFCIYFFVSLLKRKKRYEVMGVLSEQINRIGKILYKHRK